MDFLLGIFFIFMCNLFHCLSASLQRKYHSQNQLHNKNIPSHNIPEYKSPLWIFGIFLYLLSQVCNALTLMTNVPILVMVPVGGAMGLTMNIFVASLILEEEITARVIAGTCFVLVGASLVCVFGHVDQDIQWVGWNQINVFVVFWVLMMISLQITLAYSLWRTKKNRPFEQRNLSDFEIGVRVMWLANLSSSQSLVITKCLAAHIDHLIEKGVMPSQKLIIVGPVIIVLYGILNVYLINEQLRHCQIKLIGPLGFGTYVIFNTVNSLVFFSTWKSIAPVYFFYIAAGIILILTGSVLLSVAAITGSDSPEIYECVTSTSTSVSTSLELKPLLQTSLVQR